MHEPFNEEQGAQIKLAHLQEQNEAMREEIAQLQRGVIACQEQDIARLEAEKRFLVAASLIKQEPFGLVKKTDPA